MQNVRNYADYNYGITWFGPFITDSLDFDRLVVNFNLQDPYFILSITGFDVYKETRRISEVRYGLYPNHRTTYDWHDESNDPEIQEIIKRIENETCQVYYKTRYYDNHPDLWIKQADLPDHYWELLAEHPFHKNNPERFMLELLKKARYVASDNGPDKFYIPGIIEDETPIPDVRELTFYKQSDVGFQIPNIKYTGNAAVLINLLSSLGWELKPSYGKYNLYKIKVTFGTMDHIYFIQSTVPELMLPIIFDYTGRVSRLVREYKKWEDSQTSYPIGDRNFNVRLWWRTWLGYAYEQSLNNSLTELNIQSARGVPNIRTLHGRDNILNWIINALEKWLNNGVASFYNTVSYLPVLNNILNDRVLSQYDLTTGNYIDAVSGDVPTDSWDRYQNISFISALDHIYINK